LATVTQPLGTNAAGTRRSDRNFVMAAPCRNCPNRNRAETMSRNRCRAHTQDSSLRRGTFVSVILGRLYSSIHAMDQNRMSSGTWPMQAPWECHRPNQSEAQVSSLRRNEIFYLVHFWGGDAGMRRSRSHAP